MTTTAGELAGGVLIPLVAGVLNGSWNAAFSPAANLAVAPIDSKRTHDLGHNQAWVLFQFYAAIANIILCLFWAGGPQRVSYIVSEAPASSVGLVVLFSILMGVGILLFGEACRIAGVGMGTNLTIGIVMVLGTLLPLALNNQVASPSGGMILGGLAVICLGLFFSMKSLQIRTKDELEQQANRKSARESVSETCHGSDGSSNIEEGSVTKEDGDSDEMPEEESHSTFKKIVLCTLAAVLSSTLQFAFIFGSDLIEIAESSEGPGSTPESGSAAIIWLFVIPLSTISSITYGLYQSRDISISNMFRSPFLRHVKIFVCACIPWIGHIHLYGLAANVLLPPRLAAAVAWPILMSSTVAWGMILSIYLGEWKNAPADAKTKQKIGLALTSAGMVVVMASVAL